VVSTPRISIGPAGCRINRDRDYEARLETIAISTVPIFFYLLFPAIFPLPLRLKYFPVIPVIWTIFPGFNSQTPPNRRAVMAEHAAGGRTRSPTGLLRSARDLHFNIQLFEIYNLAY